MSYSIVTVDAVSARVRICVDEFGFMRVEKLAKLSSDDAAGQTRKSTSLSIIFKAEDCRTRSASGGNGSW